MKRLSGLLYGAFIGDAFALSSHWIYDTEKLALEFTEQEDYEDPSKNLFHKGKKKGDFTHYGDQSLLLLKSIATNHSFHLPTFRTHWKTFMSQYEGYIDHASKNTLAQLESANHSGSSSDELGGFSRCAPLIFYHFDDPELLTYVHQQTKMTHNDPMLLEISSFITKWALELVIGKPMVLSLENLVDKYPHVKLHYENVQKRLNTDSVFAVKDIGQSCSSQYAFPSALFILLKNQNDFMNAMKENILAGGDSAGRGMLIGMILGASLGIDKIPHHLIENLTEKSIIEKYAKHKQV